MSRQPDAGRSPKALEVLRAVRESSHEPWSLDRSTAAHWRLRQRIAEVTTPRPSRRPALAWALGAAGLAAATAAVALALIPLGELWFGPDAVSTASDIAAAPARLAAASLPRAAPAWSELDLPDLGVLEISIGVAFEVRELSSERQIRISAGTLRAHMVRQDPARPAVVVTPHLRLVVVGTRFDVHVEARRTTVEVLEGAVRVEGTLGGEVLVVGGSAIDSDDPRFMVATPPSATSSSSSWSLGAPPTPGLERTAAAAPGRTPPAPPLGVGSRRRRPVAPARGPEAPSCESLGSSREQRACFERVARGSDLAAQNALYTLGIIARDLDRRADLAIEIFRDYARRFPTGLLGPEAALGALDLLQREGRVDEALGEALEFERRFATDARAPDVTLVRAMLLCRDSARRSEALAIIDRVLRSNPSAEAAAERARSRCEPEASESVSTGSAR